MGIGLGILTLGLGAIAVFVGLILLLIGAIDSNPKLRKVAAFVILGGAISLLASFSLCSTSMH